MISGIVRAINVLAVINLALIAVLMLLFLYLLFAKIAGNRKKRRLAEFIGVSQSQSEASGILQFLQTGFVSRQLKAGSALRQEAIQDLLLQRLLATKSKTEEQRILAFAALQYASVYRAALQSRRWSKRMNALFGIERFRLKDLVPDLKELLQAPKCTEHERFLIYRAFAVFGLKDEVIPHLMQSEASYSGEQLLQLLLPFSDDALEQLCLEFHLLPLPIQRCMVDVLRLRNARSNVVLGLLEDHLFADDAELRGRCLHAIANFGYMSPGAVERFMARIEDESADSSSERLMQAKLMGMVREERYLAHLERLMSDSDYSVRQQAGESISRYKSGFDVLRRISITSSDRFAASMASETLERRSYERENT
ncbi:hypothetical protein K0T92_18390 [Paenibacillus oenotherae]|uniref:HEAT repeat domain-containing protein n=1 Tax=Paenibacillus oenotherae TaxID=1435645 RepID=A0ABS7D9S2_9BACL|nr:hypothetical protein [Paenibacillus oenotherae]MBW7476690.1 hypothetical protein [Paenibacillus oenotherae]